MTAIKCEYLDYTEEYKGTLGADMIKWTNIEAVLVAKHGWTKEAARHLVHLVRDYGAFILSHALALSVVLKQEDGEIGF